AGCEVAQGHTRMAHQVGTHASATFSQCASLVLAPEQQCSGPARGRCYAPALAELSAIFLHHDVEVGAPEAEGTVRGTAWKIARLEPWHRLVHQAHPSG